MEIGVIGCGVMGGAIAKVWSKSHHIWLFDHQLEKAEQLAAHIKGTPMRTLAELLEKSQVVLLAVKPKDFSSVAKAARLYISAEQLWISILAGTPLAILKRGLSPAHVMRVMPNLPLLYGKGVLGLVGDFVHCDHERFEIEKLMKLLGKCHWLPESKIDAFTSITSSGPAFILEILEAFIEGGIAMGFAPKEAAELAIETFQGAVALAEDRSLQPQELKMQIASPGGTTVAGLQALADGGVKLAMIRALVAACDRAKKMSEEFQQSLE